MISSASLALSAPIAVKEKQAINNAANGAVNNRNLFGITLNLLLVIFNIDTRRGNSVTPEAPDKPGCNRSLGGGV